jgi:hypothetical protein
MVNRLGGREYSEEMAKGLTSDAADLSQSQVEYGT